MPAVVEVEAVTGTANGHPNGKLGDMVDHTPAHPAFDSIPDVLKAFGALFPLYPVPLPRHLLFVSQS